MASKQARAQKRKILAEIAKLDFCLPGSLVERTTRCGTPTCHCHTDPEHRHGPYPSWIRKVGGKTVTHTLNAAQAERYQAWFDNTRRLRQLVNELEALSVQVINDTEGWHGTRPKRPDRQHVNDTPENASSTRPDRQRNDVGDIP